MRIDHLGIVSGICREIGLVETIDEAIGQTGKKVSCGEGVLAIILNALGFSSRALYLMPEYIKNKPLVLIRAGLTADDLNYDTIGRCLDEIYKYGVTELFSRVASKALQLIGIKLYAVRQQFISFAWGIRCRNAGRRKGKYYIRIFAGSPT